MKATILARAATLALLPGAAAARDLPAGGMTLDEIAAWLHDQGLTAEVQTADNGAKSIYSSIGGSNFHIYQYDCKEARCGSLQFSSGFDTKGAFNADKMNGWNRDNRSAHAYVDKVNDPWVEFDVDLTPGGSYELLNDELGIWHQSLDNFRKYINW